MKSTYALNLACGHGYMLYPHSRPCPVKMSSIMISVVLTYLETISWVDVYPACQNKTDTYNNM